MAYIVPMHVKPKFTYLLTYISRLELSNQGIKCDKSTHWHYNDVIMGAIASQITSLTIVYSALYSDADQRKHQSSASLAFVRGIHRSPHKWPDRHCVCVCFYASAFRRRRHYVFGLSVRPSVRPSVRSLKYPLLTCTCVRWSTRPTVTVLRHVRPSAEIKFSEDVRPSVRPSVRRGFRAFAGECMEGLAWNFICWCILTTFRTD